MKVGLNKKTIIEAAANMADERGIANVTLKVLATELGVKSPSLYKHFSGGLDELNKELMLYGWRLLEADITRAAIGKSKDNAVRAICLAYRKFVAEHKGVFEAMQWYNMYQSDEHLQASQGTLAVLFQVLEAYGVTEEQKVHIARMLRGFLQGFSTIESHGGFGNPTPLDDTFDFALNIILNGIRDLQGGSAQ
ncbi:MAG: TetR/AcrR family transcriptional regulator [Lachnospiraceae bacterium]|nr:TetR/AcrR family transcriptional regulator [Lachnospiraceae bacterium]